MCTAARIYAVMLQVRGMSARMCASMLQVRGMCACVGWGGGHELSGCCWGEVGGLGLTGGRGFGQELPGGRRQ